MKKLFIINDTVTNKISYWHLAAFLVMLPFDYFYCEIILISFALHTLIHVRRAYFQFIARREVLVLVSIYVLGVLSILYSPDKEEGINIATRQLAILLFPVIFALNGLDFAKYRMNLFVFFIMTCTGTIIYLYIDAIRTILYFHLPVSSLFTLAFMNHNFSLPIELHATYLSMYVAFSIIALSWLLSREKRRNRKFLYAGCILILTMGMIQLSSRAVFIAVLLLINTLFPFFVFKGKNQIRFIFISLFLSSLILFTIMYNDTFKERYISELEKDLSQKPNFVENSESRLVRWEAILEIIERSPVIGFGLGSEKKLLKEKYFEKKLYISYLNEYNTHNEYLSFLLKTGILGLALFLYVLYVGFAMAWHKKDPLFLSFILLIGMVCISENLLDLNKGIFFYSFFFSLFLTRNKISFLPEQGNLMTVQGNPG